MAQTARTTATLVQALLGSNYGEMDNGEMPDLRQFILPANLIVDRVATCAVSKGSSLSPAELEMIERWVAAYLYCHMDPLHSNESVEGASASNVTSQTLDGEQERYKRGAIELDFSGCLNAILNRKVVSATWLGKVPSQQIPYDRRR